MSLTKKIRNLGLAGLVLASSLYAKEPKEIIYVDEPIIVNYVKGGLNYIEIMPIGKDSIIKVEARTYYGKKIMSTDSVYPFRIPIDGSMYFNKKKETVYEAIIETQNKRIFRRFIVVNYEKILRELKKREKNKKKHKV